MFFHKKILRFRIKTIKPHYKNNKNEYPANFGWVDFLHKTIKNTLASRSRLVKIQWYQQTSINAYEYELLVNRSTHVNINKLLTNIRKSQQMFTNITNY